VSICDGTTHVQRRPHIAVKWDETVASAANRDTSPTAQVPKLFGPIYATASMDTSSQRPATAFHGCRSGMDVRSRTGRRSQLVRSERLVAADRDARSPQSGGGGWRRTRAALACLCLLRPTALRASCSLRQAATGHVLPPRIRAATWGREFRSTALTLGSPVRLRRPDQQVPPLHDSLNLDPILSNVSVNLRK
jgi:hypothetical protein